MLADVCFGSLADMTSQYADVCFTPESGHQGQPFDVRLVPIGDIVLIRSHRGRGQKRVGGTLSPRARAVLRLITRLESVATMKRVHRATG